MMVYGISYYTDQELIIDDFVEIFHIHHNYFFQLTLIHKWGKKVLFKK